MADLAVQTMRMRGPAGPRPPRAEAEDLLRALAPAGTDRSVLIIRRLVLDTAAPGAARRRLDDVRRRACRPVAGHVDPAADAVLFRDEAEMLACLTADLVTGQAHARWYWRTRLPRATTGPAALARVWPAAARSLPAALATLERRSPGLAARAVAQLDPAQAELVITALLAPGGPAPARTAATSPPARTEPGSLPAPRLTPAAQAPAAAPAAAAAPARPTGTGQPTPGPHHPRWADLLPPATGIRSPAGRTLLAVAAVLAAEPGAPRPELLAWARTVASEPAATAEPAATSTPPPPAAPASSPPIAARPRVPPVSRTAARSWSSPATAVSVNGPAERHERPSPPGPDPLHTCHAGVFYLINVMLRVTGDDLTWPDLAGFARHLLRARPGARRRARDPVWRLFRDLSGLDRLPPRRRRDWWRPALELLAEHELGPQTFEQPGRVLVTATHVDVVMGLEQIDLAARICGLDQDPGWLPQLGRTVAFHFEDRR